MLAACSMVASGAVVVSPSVSQAAATALHFDGVNDYVTFGNSGNATELGLSTFTIETWFMRDGNGVATTTSSAGGGGFVGASTDGIIPLVAKGRGEGDNSNVDMNYILGITTGTSIGTHLGADFEEGVTANPGLNHRVVGSATIQNGVWYHAAATYDGVDFKLYLNGNLDGQVLGINRPPRSDSIQHASLGSALTSTGASQGAFAGSIDEARIWNYARSQAEISGSMNAEISTDPGGLVARWGLEEGSGTTAGDSIAPASNGTLTNSPTWVSGFTPIVTEPHSVDFNGSSTAIAVPDSSALDTATFTVEAWVNRAAGGATSSTGNLGLNGTDGPLTYPVITKGRAQSETADTDINYWFGITLDGKVAADFEEAEPGTNATGRNHPIVGATTIPLGVWHHIAATYDGTTWTIYVDGQTDATLAVGQPANAANTARVGIGVAYQSGPAGAAEGAFAGLIDEARIWNVARTPGEMLASYDQETHVWLRPCRSLGHEPGFRSARTGLDRYQSRHTHQRHSWARLRGSCRRPGHGVRRSRGHRIEQHDRRRDRR